MLVLYRNGSNCLHCLVWRLRFSLLADIVRFINSHIIIIIIIIYRDVTEIIRNGRKRNVPAAFWPSPQRPTASPLTSVWPTRCPVSPANEAFTNYSDRVTTYIQVLPKIINLFNLHRSLRCNCLHFYCFYTFYILYVFTAYCTVSFCHCTMCNCHVEIKTLLTYLLDGSSHHFW